ncbi:transposase [Enterococcus hirae]|uniref:transposase n=1 Tax=Enterococcus hirae TaxID=1354 RepID=UPI003BF5A6D6
MRSSRTQSRHVTPVTRDRLAYFTTGGVSNGGTEAISLQIEKTRRLAHGYRNFTNYRLRLPLAAHRPSNEAPLTTES